jgi:apolipoprotein N-acyltransferase
VDILLVPAYDTYQTRVYHTEVGLLRAVDYGFSVARMVNEGTSMAVDYRGQVLASQDFFTTSPQVMNVDLPTHGVSTLYAQSGDGFAWLCAAYAVIFLGVGLSRPARPAQA